MKETERNIFLNVLFKSKPFARRGQKEAVTMNATTLQNRSADLGLLLIRAILGMVFIYHGGQKLFGLFGGYGIEGTAGWMASIGIPFPTLSAILAGTAEFFGGIVLILGTGTRLAAIPLAFTMLVAIVTTHPSAFAARAGGMEYALTLGVVAAALALTGPGRLTVGTLIANASAKTRRETSDSPRAVTA
jgi:putative oxidoreductase